MFDLLRKKDYVDTNARDSLKNKTKRNSYIKEIVRLQDIDYECNYLCLQLRNKLLIVL